MAGRMVGRGPMVADSTEKKDMEKSKTIMVCLDKVNNPGHLIALAKSGAVVSVIGGPPCRTVSACRSKSPGPRPVRSEEHPYQFPDLTNSEREMVEGGSIVVADDDSLPCGGGSCKKEKLAYGGIWTGTTT